MDQSHFFLRGHNSKARNICKKRIALSPNLLSKDTNLVLMLLIFEPKTLKKKKIRGENYFLEMFESWTIELVM